MTDQPTGRALAEAAARAMGWRLEMGAWYRGDGTFAGNILIDGINACLTEREMLAWLHRRRGRSTVMSTTNEGASYMLELWVDDRQVAVEAGPTLRDALMRLVVAVAEREAKA